MNMRILLAFILIGVFASSTAYAFRVSDVETHARLAADTQLELNDAHCLAPAGTEVLVLGETTARLNAVRALDGACTGYETSLPDNALTDFTYTTPSK